MGFSKAGEDGIVEFIVALLCWHNIVLALCLIVSRKKIDEGGTWMEQDLRMSKKVDYGRHRD